MYTMRAANTCGGERYVEAERGAMCLGNIVWLGDAGVCGGGYKSYCMRNRHDHVEVDIGGQLGGAK